jgi:oligopeptide transport system permease protein
MAIDRREVALPVGAAHTEPAAAAGAPIRQASLWRDAWHRYIRNRGAVIAAIVFICIGLYALIVPGFWKVPGLWTSLADLDPNKVDFADAYLPFSTEHPLGTDKFGRDIFARAAAGGQISIAIGFVATFFILVIGVVYGSIAGFVGGKLDNAMMRFLDALYGLPYLPFAIITLAIIGTQNFFSMTIALTVASWFTAARIVRGQIITLKENDYVRAARAVGARWYRVLARHLIPNTLGVLIIAIFLELGINPPDASWGSMAQDGRDAYRSHPTVLWIPSLFIATMVLCANFIADGLRDALDPRTRET